MARVDPSRTLALFLSAYRSFPILVRTIPSETTGIRRCGHLRVPGYVDTQHMVQLDGIPASHRSQAIGGGHEQGLDDCRGRRLNASGIFELTLQVSTATHSLLQEAPTAPTESLKSAPTSDHDSCPRNALSPATRVAPPNPWLLGLGSILSTSVLSQSRSQEAAKAASASRPSRSLYRSSSLLESGRQVGCGYRPSWAKSGHPMPNSKCLDSTLDGLPPSASDAFRTSPALCPPRFSYSSLPVAESARGPCHSEVGSSQSRLRKAQTQTSLPR